MKEAWIKRSVERQEVIEKLKRKIFDLEEEVGRTEVDYALTGLIMDFLRDGKTTKCRCSAFADPFFVNEILPAFREFSRSKKEFDAMLCTLLEWLVQSITSTHKSALSSEEIFEPQKIFHAESAMTPVEE